MKRMIGVAALLGLLAAGALATSAHAQPPACGSGPLIDWDADCFSFEPPAVPGPGYDPSTFFSAAGSPLTVVGIVTYFCSPFLDLNANMPGYEYTFVFSGLTSSGTTSFVVGPTTVYNCSYGTGTFGIYEDTTPDAPHAGSMPALPSPTVPGNFQDPGNTLILSGPLTNFQTQITVTPPNPANGSFRANYQFTGGSLLGRVLDTGEGLVQGLWCVSGSCVPNTYSAHPDGKFDTPPTLARSSTWGAIKQLYR